MTANDILTPVRVNLADAAGTTWTDANLRAYIEEGVRVIHRDEPESRFDNRGNVQTQGAVSANTTALLLDTLYEPALVHFVCARAYEGEGSDQRDTEAAKRHWARFDKSFRNDER